MRGAYRDFSKYIKNLELMIENSRVLRGFETRIYTDDTGADISLKVAERYPDVSVYHFDCELFREGEGHVGTFGTLVRFLPMFEEGLKMVWISDLDVNNEQGWFSNKFVKLCSNYDVFAENRVCYERRPWNFGKKYPFVAYRMLFTKTFPRRMLTHYINKLADGSLKSAIDEVNDYNIRKPRNERFPYGMDEYFINGVIYDYVKKHNMKCLFRKKYSLTGWFDYDRAILTEKERRLAVELEYNPSRELVQKLKPIYRKGIQGFLEKDPVKYACFKETLDKLDSFKDDMMDWEEVDGKDL